MLTLCVFEGTSLHCSVKLVPDRSIQCTWHSVMLYGEARCGKTGSEHLIGTGKGCSPRSGSQSAPGLGRRKLRNTKDLQESLALATARMEAWQQG